MLRRVVREVASDLPDLISIDVPLEMFEPERAAYEALFGSSSRCNVRDRRLPC